MNMTDAIEFKTPYAQKRKDNPNNDDWVCPHCRASAYPTKESTKCEHCGNIYRLSYWKR
jgi:hypothetical protein